MFSRQDMQEFYPRIKELGYSLQPAASYTSSCKDARAGLSHVSDVKTLEELGEYVNWAEYMINTWDKKAISRLGIKVPDKAFEKRE